MVHSLCVSLLQETRPKLVPGRGVDEDQFVANRRQPVIDQNLFPVSAPPNSEPEDPGVPVTGSGGAVLRYSVDGICDDF